MLSLADPGFLLALSRYGRHVLALLLCAGPIAPCRAVFAVDARRQHARIHIFKSPTTNFWKQKALLLIES